MYNDAYSPLDCLKAKKTARLGAPHTEDDGYLAIVEVAVQEQRRIAPFIGF